MSACRFFNTPQGCRRGSNCTFLHQQPSPDGQVSANPKPVSPKPRVELKAPPGVCRYFFNYGHCKLGDCKFRHTDPTSVPSSKGAGSLGVRYHSAFDKAPSSSGDGDDTSSKLAPTEVIQHITNFCAPRVQFNKPFQMTSFAKLLATSGDPQKHWVSVS
jgi:hypothetical protein